MSADFGSGAWWNERLVAAVDRAGGPLEEWARRYLKGGEAMGYAMPTYNDILEMDAVQAIELVTGMLRVPYTQARAVSLLRRIVQEKYGDADA